MVLWLIYLTLALGQLSPPAQTEIMQTGERFILPTFSQGVVALTMQEDGALQTVPFLALSRVGPIVVIDALTEGRLAMAGFQQLLRYDEAQDLITPLTDFPTPIDWHSISLSAEAHLGIFESIDPIDGIRVRTWLTDLTADPLRIAFVKARLSPSLSMDGRLVGITEETPLDPINLYDPLRHVGIFPIEDLHISADPLFTDSGDGWCFGIEFHPTAYRVAYLCDYATLVIYDLEADVRQEFAVKDGLCVRWSPEGERVVITVFPIGAEAPFYTVIELATGASQVLTVPQDMPNYDATVVCPVWLGAQQESLTPPYP